MPRGKATKPPQRTQKPKIDKPIEVIAIEQKEDSMKVTKDTPKWGQFTVATHNLTFEGEELVTMSIPYDDQNPVNHHIVCINGNQIILGVDTELIVPKSVYENWTTSLRETNRAKRNMKQMTELKV